MIEYLKKSTENQHTPEIQGELIKKIAKIYEKLDIMEIFRQKRENNSWKQNYQHSFKIKDLVVICTKQIKNCQEN
jgi:translation elongation factor EF-Ts